MTTKAKSIEETYQLKSDIEHIFDLPDTYIGSIEKTQIETWTLDDKDERMEFKNIEYIPGLYKIFDEILVNTIDQHVRIENDDNYANKVTQIKVNINKEQNLISIMNNGEGIPVEIHKQHNIYIPEMILGNLRSSSNYDQNEKKITGGKNGLGGKLANIFSTYFRIETIDSTKKLKYIQEYRNNMTEKGEPQITKFAGKPYTKIDFSPDLRRFNLERLDEGTVQFMKKRVIDTTACTGKKVSVYLNDKLLDCKTLEKYVNYYLNEMSERVYEECGDRWEVVVAVNPDAKFEQVSFVNGVYTLKGGRHVDSVVNSITKAITTIASTKGIKRKKVDIKPADIKNNMFIFVRSTIENPSFDSQIKENLTTPMTKFGSRYEPSEKFIEKLMKTSLIERAMKLTDFKENLGLQKTSGKKSTRISGVEKLDDANKAGTEESGKCTLILTEGDSAKALAIAGLSVVGRDYFGVFPLKGKVMNVRDTDKRKVSANEEIANLVKILGLKYSDKKRTKEEVLQELRYGRIMLFTDSDVDGSHIKGLIVNLFAYFWPELLEIPGFIIALATPIIKAKHGKEVQEFYTLTEFEQWKETMDTIKNWDIKYYKGLGTSTSEEAKEYFENFENKKIEYLMSEFLEGGMKNEEQFNLSLDRIELAFQKSREDDRKNWLKTYDRNEIIEQTQKRILFSEFVDKDLKHFSNYDCLRSIPSMVDGLKPSLRKILYACLKRNLKKEIKVSQLAGYVSEVSNYHHGEASLLGGIIGMAQDFVGSNNIELLTPNGQFGTRILGGADAASPRYIFTQLNNITQYIFNSADNALLDYLDDDGDLVEPLFYVPVIPMILVNGSVGIGTGYSCRVPPHDPLVIIRNLIHLMDNEELEEMKPWFRGFIGDIVPKSDTNENTQKSYINKGKYEVLDDTKIRITELPIGKWTSKYQTYLEELMNEKIEKSGDDNKSKAKINKYVITKIDNNSTDKKVDFTVQFKKGIVEEMQQNNIIEDVLDLVDSKNTGYTNMHMFNCRGIIAKYESTEDILKEFYIIRLAYYVKRKEYLLKVLRRELDIYEAKIKFITEFINNDIQIIQKEDEEIYAQLEERNYPKFGDEDEPNKMNYNYLLSMQIRTLTKKKIEELKRLHENKLAEFRDLESKSEKDIWKDDLFALREVYEKNLEIYYEKINSGKSAKKSEATKKKTVAKRTTKK